MEKKEKVIDVVPGEIQIESQEQPDTGSGLDSWIVVVEVVLYRKPACECYLNFPSSPTDT